MECVSPRSYDVIVSKYWIPITSIRRHICRARYMLLSVHLSIRLSIIRVNHVTEAYLCWSGASY